MGENRGVRRASAEWTGAPSTAVVEAIAKYEGVDPIDLEPVLFEHVRPDALDDLVESADEGIDVSFTAGQYRVHVDEEAVTVSPAE